MGAFFSGGKGWITEPRRFSAWFGCPPQAAAFAKLLPSGFRRRKAGSEPPPPYKRHPKTGAFFSGGKGWITEPRRFSAWFGCPPKSAAFAKLLPTGSRRRKAGSEPPPHIRTSKRRPFFCGGKRWITEPRRFSAWFGCPPQAAAFAKLLPTGSRRRKAGSEPPPPYKRHPKGACLRVVGRGGSPNHCALARGSAVRRRRQLSRSCCHLAFEDEKREANLHPLTKGTR